MIKKLVFLLFLVIPGFVATAEAQQSRGEAASVPTPTDVKPGSITCEDVPYPYPDRRTCRSRSTARTCGWLTWTCAPPGTPNGHTVVLFHGNNFAGFYFGGPIDALRKEGFRVDRAGSDRLRPIVEADHSVQLQRHGAQHAR